MFSLNKTFFIFVKFENISHWKIFSVQFLNFAKFLKVCHFVVGGSKTSHFYPIVAFKKLFRRLLLLFSCAYDKVDLDDIQSNEVATSTARNFNNSWPLYLNFSNMINLFSNIWNCHQFSFWIKNRQKSQIFHFLKGLYFEMGDPITINVDVLENFCGLPKECGFATFYQKYNQR